ncbi:MAG: tetratricopeptide repeat protein [Candidatus Thermochlorobacter sp.]
MKFVFSVILWLSCALCCGWAQEQIKTDQSSLLSALADAKDTVRAEVLHRLVRYYWRNELDSVMHYAKELLSLSQSLGYKHGIANAYNAISYVYERRADFPKAMETRMQALTVYESIKDKNGIAWCYHSLGNIYDYQAKYDLSLDYHFKALKLREELQDRKGIFWSLNRIGDSYANQGKHALSLEYCTKALKLAEELELQEGICSAAIGVAMSYLSLSHYAEAKRYALNALTIAQRIGDQRYADMALTTLGESEMHESNYDQAMQYFIKGLAIRQERKMQNAVAESLERIGRTLFLQKKYDAALQYAQRALETAEQVQARSEAKNAYKLLSDIYRSKGDYANALTYFEKFTALKDSLFSLETEKHIAELQLSLENERKDHEIEALQKDREAKMIVQRSLVLLAMLSMMIIVLIALSYRQKVKQNAKLSELNAMLTVAREKAEKERQTAEEANAFKTELLGIAAHDLQNPLQSIMGFSMLIIEKLEGQPEAKFMAENITHASQRMLHIITDLLKTSALDSGTLMLNKRMIDVNTLLQTVISGNMYAAERKLQKVTVHLEPHLYAEMDSERMREVFENLISNAIKYSPKGTCITISSSRRSKISKTATVSHAGTEIKNANRNTTILVSIQDEGQGLTQDDMKKLFGKFQRLSARPTDGESSTGLGLSIVKKIVELHGGRVWAESEGKGKGSTFFVELPLIATESKVIA